MLDEIRMIDGREVKLSHRDKVLFPKSGITKGDILNYYEQVATHMLPFLKDRPLTMKRFPDGIKEGFYQRQMPDYFPKWIKSVEVRKEGGTVRQVVCNDVSTLLYLANQYVLSFHTWLSRKDKVEYPDKIIFDLDPPKGKFELVAMGAKALKNLLEKEFNLVPLVMTTGSKGLHVVVPIRRKYHFDEVRGFARQVADQLAESNSNTFTTEVRKNKRKGRLFLDYLRNVYAQTGVTPYSVRAIENAPVATPLTWKELDDPNLHSQSFNIKSILKRLSKVADPWKDYTQKVGMITLQ